MNRRGVDYGLCVLCPWERLWRTTLYRVECRPGPGEHRGGGLRTAARPAESPAVRFRPGGRRIQTAGV